jgi:hypothetical protein
VYRVEAVLAGHRPVVMPHAQGSGEAAHLYLAAEAQSWHQDAPNRGAAVARSSG